MGWGREAGGLRGRARESSGCVCILTQGPYAAHRGGERSMECWQCTALHQLTRRSGSRYAMVVPLPGGDDSSTSLARPMAGMPYLRQPAGGGVKA